MFMEVSVINIVVLFFLLIVIPWIVGMLYTGFLPEERNGFMLSWVAGYIILWGLFEIVALPLIFQRKSLGFLCTVYVAAICTLIVIALIRNRHNIVSMLKGSIYSLRNISFIGWINLFLVLGQAYIYIRYMHIDEDDAFYVGEATTAVATDTIFSVDPYTGEEYTKLPSRYMLSPFFSFVAFLSRISHVHPAITAHVVLAVILILLSYAVYFLIGKKLLSGQQRYADFFLFFLILIILFSGYSVYTQGMFTLVRIWQGKAVFCAILAPVICYMMLWLVSEKAVMADWWLSLVLMCACCMVSSMGIMLGAVMLGIFGILCSIKKKNIKPFIYTILCCTPNLICAGIYLVYH